VILGVLLLYVVSLFLRIHKAKTQGENSQNNIEISD
jgi:hypothetical protein